MQLFHRSSSMSATFDDTNLVSAAGLIPAMALAVKTGLGNLADTHLKLPGYFGANAGLKVTALVAGMCWGRLDRRHGVVASRRDEETIHRDVCPLHVGIVPAHVHLRPCSPARRNRLAMAGQRGHSGPDW